MSHKAIWEVVKIQNEADANFSFSALSEEDVLKFQHCVDECIQLLSSAGPSRRASDNSFILSWCNQSSQVWFHELYYELWRRSFEINTWLQIVQPYCVPVFLGCSILQMTVLSILLLCSSELRKENPLWLFLLCYCVLSELKMIVASLLFTVLGKQFPKTNFFCRSQQFLCSTLATLPNWILAETLVNQTLASLRCASLSPVGMIGARIIITFSVISIVVLNAHSLWLYSVDQLDKACNIHMHSQDAVLVIGYPIYLEMIENLIPGTLIVSCVAILLYCRCKQSRQQDHQVRTSICLGINFFLFNFSSTVYWFVTSFVKTDSSLKTFNDLKSNTLFMKISNILAEQSNMFVLPIVLLCSPLFRKNAHRLIERTYKRIHDSIASKNMAIVMADKDLKDHAEITLPLVRIEICK